ncbi:uncharacterized protein LTR77_002473 [Saxophila tyrrhenica]|uniref:NmrA-like domain-containing protein n=1 Tax=Saxophila tyrrhenica TaxID=1690608 RepID=A0AAV9PIZ4_9PEZI|nr:hypothetical protein LTR77_002473 [Saxophila tyrrhenica]
MSSSTPLKSIILVGPGGSLGSVLLEGLLYVSTFSVSVLVRESSKSIGSLPADRLHKIVKIADSYPQDEIIAAFQGQDAVVNAITSTLVEEQLRFIDAAIEAGVKRYVPSEYGMNNLRPEARALNSVFDGKGKVQEYLKSKESTGLTWNAIGCGMWIDWSLKNNFLGLNYATKTITMADEGKGKFSTSTMENTYLAVNRCLLNPEMTKNTVVYISDFVTTQADLVAAIERIRGEKWNVEQFDSYKAIEENKKKVEAGDHLAVYKLIEIGFVTGRYGGWLEEKEKIWNQDLGLPKQEFEDVVRKGLEKMKA